jgi:serine/threonine protein kinase
MAPLRGMVQQHHHRYLLLGQIAGGRGSGTAVFAAVDQLLGRDVALKVQTFSRQLLAESGSMARFDHPNIVRVFEAGVQGNCVYAAMELCEGDLIKQHFSSAASDPPGGALWTVQLDRLLEAGSGILAVHQAGLVHGDVKPANILIKGGHAKIGDFGTAKPPGRSRLVAGTPGYVAPELLDHQVCSPAGDVFAFACTAWTCLTGRHPFGDPPICESSAAMLVYLERSRRREIQHPTITNGLPMKVLESLGRGMEHDPACRPSLSELLSELAQIRSAPRTRLSNWWAQVRRVTAARAQIVDP